MSNSLTGPLFFGNNFWPRRIFDQDLAANESFLLCRLYTQAASKYKTAKATTMDPNSIPTDFNTWDVTKLRTSLEKCGIQVQTALKKPDLVYLCDGHAVDRGHGPRLADTQKPDFSLQSWRLSELRRFFISEGVDYRPRATKIELQNLFREKAYDCVAPPAALRLSGFGSPARMFRSRSTGHSSLGYVGHVEEKHDDVEEDGDVYNVHFSDDDDDDDDDDAGYHSDDTPGRCERDDDKNRNGPRASSTVVRGTSPDTPASAYRASSSSSGGGGNTPVPLDDNKPPSDAMDQDADDDYMITSCALPPDEARHPPLTDQTASRIRDIVHLMNHSLDQLDMGRSDRAKLLLIEALVLF